MNKPVSMSNMEKLARAFESLKSHQQGSLSENGDSKKSQLSKKEYIQHLSIIADGICASNFKTVADFPKFLAISFELIFVACNEENSDIRLKAEECLNKIIKASLDTSLSRTQLELYKEIKKNGPSKSLRAALWRFAEVAHFIRPQKCRPYIINLLPCIAKISRREEDAVQEALASFIEKVLPVLGSFLTDTEVKNLMKVLFPNLKSPSAATRRSASKILVLVCRHGRKTPMYFSMLVQTLIMIAVPITPNLSSQMCLGVLQCLRNMLPYLTETGHLDHGLKGSIGVVKTEEKAELKTKQLVQLYEFTLHCTQNSDHNAVTASLETLQQLLRTPPPNLKAVLLTPGSIQEKSINHEGSASDGSDVAKEADTSQVFSVDSGLEDDQVSLNTSLSTKSELSSTANLSDIGLDTPDTSTVSSYQDSLFESDLGETLSEQGEIITADEADEYSNVNIGTEEEISQLDEIDVSKGLTYMEKDRKSITEEELITEEEEEVEEDEKEDATETNQESEVIKGDIGCYTDEDIPLQHLMRLLCSSFLLTGEKACLIRDRRVRVSVKTLALGCIGHIVGMVPELFFIQLFKSRMKGDADQFVRDVLLYYKHSDHQLRSQTAIIVGHFLHAALRKSHYQFDFWALETAQNTVSEPLHLPSLVTMLRNALRDESSITIRFTCQAVKTCIADLFMSSYDHLGAQLTYDLLDVGKSSYWLLQVELLDLIGNLNFRLLNFVETQQKVQNNHLLKCHRIQEALLEEVVMILLGSDDTRVRTKAAETIIKIIPKLYFADNTVHSDPVSAVAKEEVRLWLGDIILELPNYSQLPTVTMKDLSLFQDGQSADEPELEGSFSRVINMLLQRLNGQCDKFLMNGIIQTLCLLGYEYSAFVYPSSWNCATNMSALSKSSASRPVKRQNNGKSSGSGMSSTGSVGSHVSLEELCQGSGCGPLPLVMGLLTSSTLMLDLSAHQDLLTTATNLLIGAAYQSMKTGPSKAQAADVNAEDRDSWQCLQNRLLVPLAQQLLTHVVRLLGICHHVIEGKEPGPPKIPVPVLPSLPITPSLSPIKKRGIKYGRDKKDAGELQAQGSPSKLEQADKSDMSEEKKPPKSTLGHFHQHPHYTKLYDTLKVSFNNYKVSLDLSKADKLQVFIKFVLNALSQLLEVTSLTEIGKYTDEILTYLKSCVSIDSSGTILAVEQLLKALFSANLVSQSEFSTNSLPRTPGKAARLTSMVRPGLYHHCFMAPYTQYTQSLASLGPRLTHTGVEAEKQSTGVFGWIKLKPDKKTNTKEKTSVHNYIRLFEPLVIQALKQYTVTSSVILQQQVLHLLGQLVQLRVNYRLLDSDQVFLGFILKQFEHMEEGQIRDYQLLIPHIFHFLVMLSHERYNSNAVIALPQIIQLTGGIMASGQRASTHIIPAFRPLVQDLFVVKGQNKSESSKELDIMREVMVSNLLTLIKYHQVLELLVPVLYQAHRESEEKWKRLSRQVVDLLMPLLARQEVDIDTDESLSTLHHLLGTVSPIALRPVDILLKALFLVPCPLTSRKSVQRWLALVLVLLCMLTTQSKEETILARLKELGLTVDLFVCPEEEEKDKDDDLVTRMPNKPEDIFARFLLQTIGFVASSLIEQVSQPKMVGEEDSFMAQEAARLLLYLTHMFKSGAFRKVPLAMSAMLKSPSHSCWFSLKQLNSFFVSLIPTHPLIVIEWCQLLLIFGCAEKEVWIDFLRTPNRPPLSKSLSKGSIDHLDQSDEVKLTMSEEIVKRGALVLFSDFVCESHGDAEPMTWLIVNHVNDLVQLSHEHPVQYLISAIHRNSAASGLFVHAVNLRFLNFNKPRLVQSALQCLEGIHLSQSGVLLSLLIKSFLSCHWLALTKLADGLACRRIEMMLGENVEGASQMTVEDVDKLLKFLEDDGLSKRHPRLLVLLQKYKSVLVGGSGQTSSGAPPRAKLLDLPRDTNKEWYKSVVTDVCIHQESVVPTSKVCAQLLSHLTVEDILSIMVAQEFDYCHLPECISLGLELSVTEGSFQTTTEKTGESSEEPKIQSLSLTEKPTQSALLEASIGSLLTQIQEFVHHLPEPHGVLSAMEELPEDTQQDEEEDANKDYMDQMKEVFHSTHHATFLRWMSGAVKEYLISTEMLKLDVTDSSRENVCRVVMTCVEYIYWSLFHHQIIPTIQLKHTLEALSLVLTNSQLRAVFNSEDHVSYTNSLVTCLYGLVFKVFLQAKPQDGGSAILQGSPSADFEANLETCYQVAGLVDLIQPSAAANRDQPTIYSLPQFLQQPIRDVITCLARLPLVNTFARTPPLAWKMGWSPSPMEQQTTFLPPCPLDILKERDVLAEFVFRINTIGWTSRHQFEETWAALLGVIGSPDIVENVEEDIEHSQSTCLAVRAITSLLINTRLRPQPGNPTNSRQLCIPRHEHLPFLSSDKGKKLAHLRGILERKGRHLFKDRFSPKSMTDYTSHSSEEVYDDLLRSNQDQDIQDGSFTVGQLSVHGIWAINNLLPPLVDEHGVESPLPSPKIPPTKTAKGSAKLDVHSCLMLLLEVFGQWLSPIATPRTPLMQLCETVKSVLVISDIFTEKSQFEWMFDILLEVNKYHYVEDEIINQFVVPGICKAAAILGMDKDVSEKVSKLLEVTLKSNHLPSRVGALYGALYLLESDVIEDINVFIPVLVEYINKNLPLISQSSTGPSQKHALVMLAVTFYLMEYYADILAGSQFTKTVLLHLVNLVSMSDDTTSLLIYKTILIGLERLLVAKALTAHESDQLRKLATDRLCLPSSPVHALPALGLLLTSSYTREELSRRTYPVRDQPDEDVDSSDPEEFVQALERQSILFDRIRKGYPTEASLVAEVLPTFLEDFFSPQDVMNKVIGEFLSNQQPHPQLMATIVYRVFAGLHRQGQSELVQDWVLLSLSNFTQRTPVAMAVWSLSVFFMCASTNQWVQNLLPLVLSRMGKLDLLDRELFVLFAKDFYYSQITESSARRAFVSTFQTVSASEMAYNALLNEL